MSQRIPSASADAGKRKSLDDLLDAIAEQWLQPWAERSATVTIAGHPAVRYEPDACRAWLNGGAADMHGIDTSFQGVALNIPAGLDALLTTLHETQGLRVWQRHPLLHRVSVWQTADADGVDGGAIITADLILNQRRVRLATRHQGFDDFTTDSATVGVDAAVQALGHVADLLNAELQAFPWFATTDAYVVIGNRHNQHPIPVTFRRARLPRFLDDTCVIQTGSWWAAAVHAASPDEAKQAAVAAMRAVDGS